MLEIVILFVLAGKIGKIVEQKGRKKIGFQLMLVGMWFGGEIFGAILGSVIGAMASDTEDGAMLFAVLGGLGCAIVAAVVAFQIAKNLQPLDVDDEFYRGIEYADDHGVRERFRERGPLPPAAADAYTDNPERVRRPLDDRVQE